MTEYERLMSVLSGKQPDRIPVVPWVRDWCGVQAGYGIVDIIEDTCKHVYSQFYCKRKFGYDAVFDLFGVCAESEAMGTVIRYDNETPPMAVEHPIRDYASDLQNLKVLDPSRDGRIPGILEGIKRLKELCRDTVPVIGYVQGPLRHASMLRGSELLMRDMYKNRGPLKEFLEIVVESLIVYGTAVVKAGADIILIGDPSASGDAISRKQWEEWGLPGTIQLVQSLKRTGTKIILHICGNISDRLELFPQTGIDALSVDEKIDLEAARHVLGDAFCLFGNLSPSKTLFFGTPADVENESRKCIEKAGRNGPFILASGCVVPGAVPPENIAAMVHAAEEYGRF